jgi:hypothetical protein
MRITDVINEDLKAWFGKGKKDGKAGIARAVKRKRSKDPNPSRKGKSKNVKN